MKALGIESTAWNFSTSVSSGDEVLSLESTPYEPEAGGIHPREASRSHARNAANTISRALESAGIKPGELDLVAFARGPGMGPCLRVGGTAARALAASLDIPILGVNHCLAHVEAGLFDTDTRSPVVLNASGANAQVLLGRDGRYRVFGETLDIGIGNAIDKLAREAEMDHPGGPRIEEAAKGSEELLDLPYGVKGTDLTFSGIVTAAAKKLEKGANLSDVANSFQETVFSMAAEVSERCMAHAGRDELLLVGGVGKNERLGGMLEEMCDERGAEFHRPSGHLLGDNGAMIALTGIKMERWGVRGAETIEQGQRIDQVEAPWIGEEEGDKVGDFYRGAEAVVTLGETALKRRVPKGYRHRELDRRIRRRRTEREALAMRDARRAGVPTPLVLRVEGDTLEMERVDGHCLKEGVDGESLETYVQYLARLHNCSLVHGDPTTSNAVKGDGELMLIDFGMASREERVEQKAVDLHLFLNCLKSSHPYTDALAERLEELYSERAHDGGEVLERVVEIEQRGRYL